MIELAHFSQFFSFALGLVVLYIAFSIKQTISNTAFNAFFWILTALIIITFFHVMEAFLKLILKEDFHTSKFRLLFQLPILPLAGIRLFIANRFIFFTHQLFNKSFPRIYNQIAIGCYAIFLIIMLLDLIPDKDLIPVFFESLTILSIQFILSLSIVYSSVYIIKNKEHTIKPKLNKIYPYFHLLILYALASLLLKGINFPVHRISEHFQMFNYALATFLFYGINIIYLKQVFTSEPEKSTNLSANKLFEKFGITKREQDIIALVCKGKTNKEIGEELFISPVTVRDHLSSIYKKTNIHNRTQLSRLFLSQLLTKET